MQINNYAVSQPKFGKLNSCVIKGCLDIKKQPETANLIKTLRNSEAIALLFNKYDGDIILEAFEGKKIDHIVSCSKIDLNLNIRKKNEKDSLKSVLLKYIKWGNEINFPLTAIKKMSEFIKNLKFENLEEDYFSQIGGKPSKKCSADILEDFGKTVDNLIN